MRGSLARASTTAFAVHLGGAGLTYCAQLLIARAVGPDGYGIYAYVLACMTTLAYFAALGFDVALLRFVPAYAAREEWGLLRGVLRFAERWVAILALGVAGACAACALLWPRQEALVLTRTFLVGSWLVPLLALLWVRSATVRGFGGVLTALGPMRMVQDGGVVCAVGLAAFVLGASIGPAWVMGATLASSALGLLLVSLAARHLRPANLRSAPVASDARVWLITAIPFLTLGAVETATNRTGTVLLGWFGM
ncbi:MAG: oligosaccharide flippase family protein, partial [Acetobacteraceae bacterium]|nr:oligosaccharide flippase family protein [Acetobacteraceae bacterium]